jgi:hypothetical protein
MMSIHRVRLALPALTALAAGASRLGAQVCNGTPAHGGAAYEYARMSVGSSQGLNATLAGGRTALGAGFAIRDVGDDVTGQQGSLRFSLVFPAGKVAICPGLGLVYQHDTWDAPNDAKLTTHNLGARAGVGLGFEQDVYHGFSLSPYVVAQYEFAVSVFDLKVTSSDEVDAQTTGDTASRVQIEYGLIGRYHSLYAGIAAHRTSDTDGIRPYMARFLVGFAFSGGGRSKKSSMNRNVSVSRRAAPKYSEPEMRE